MRNRRSISSRGFSLIELVIVVVIIAIIGAIAIPRMSRGAAGAADSALTGNLSVLRSAIDLYQTEHGGTFPTAVTIEPQLTQYSDTTGATNQAKGISCASAGGAESCLFRTGVVVLEVSLSTVRRRISGIPSIIPGETWAGGNCMTGIGIANRSNTAADASTSTGKPGSNRSRSAAPTRSIAVLSAGGDAHGRMPRPVLPYGMRRADEDIDNARSQALAGNPVRLSRGNLAGADA